MFNLFPSGEHRHKYESEYSYNQNYHYHKCEDSSCNTVDDMIAHTYDEEIIKVKNGIKFKFECNENEVLIVDKDDNPIAIYEKENGIYRSKRGLF